LVGDVEGFLEQRAKTAGDRGWLGLVGVSTAQQTIDDLKHSEVASERGKRIDAGERARGSSTVLVSTKSSGGFPEHRRAISPR
jgi:hypothetical protein